jgi:uncharacterized protein YndB with AHSA1/START domain
MKANDQHGKFNGPAEVRIVRTLPGPIERIWEYLTDPEKRARWFAGGPMEQKVGGKMRLEFKHKNLAPDEVPPEQYKKSHEGGHGFDAVVTKWEPPHLLGYTFGSDGESEVTFELTPQGKNVLLILTHRSTGGDVPYIVEFATGWHAHVAYLIALLEGAPRPAFWALNARLKTEYEQLFASNQTP